MKEFYVIAFKFSPIIIISSTIIIIIIIIIIIADATSRSAGWWTLYFLECGWRVGRGEREAFCTLVYETDLRIRIRHC
jgi:hypothetical protein